MFREVLDYSKAPNFPEVIDSSLISTYYTCERKGFWEYFRHQVPTGINPHFNAGGAYAKAMETFRRSYYGQAKLSFEDARAAGFTALTKTYGEYDAPEGKTYKQWINVIYAYLFYLEYYHPANDHMHPLIVEGEPFVEFSFAHPIDVTHPVTGNPILYAGKIDAVYTPNDTQLFLLDDKTTGQMGAQWPEQWRMRGQFTGYKWGLEKYGYKIDGVIVRGVSIQKTQNKYLEVPVYRPEWRIDRWYTYLCSAIEKMKLDWERQNWPTSGEFSGACEDYGGCQYKQLCESPNPEEWVSSYFQEHHWSPLQKED